jgi:hypothetical protein
MTVNAFQISARTAGLDPRITANGSYTLPQYAFIPHSSLQHMATGAIAGPMPAGISSADFAAPAGIQQRPYPTPHVPLYGVRSLHYKSSP